MEVMENLNVESLGLGDIDFSDIGGLIEMVKNPEHPVTKRAISAVQKMIEQKMRNGSLRRRISFVKSRCSKRSSSIRLDVFSRRSFSERPRAEQEIARPPVQPSLRATTPRRVVRECWLAYNVRLVRSKSLYSNNERPRTILAERPRKFVQALEPIRSYERYDGS